MEDLIFSIEDKEYKAVFDKNDPDTIYINDKPFQVEILKKLYDNIFSFVVNQRLWQVDLEFDPSGNQISIDLDGFSYQIEVHTETRKMLEKFIQKSGRLAGSSQLQVKAPMPGMVVKYFVKVGDFVNQGDNLVIVEAMKMENVLKSPMQGTIRKIHYKENAPVEKDSILLEFVPEVDTNK
ncbi:MAG: acetyl-CoA carboxylase biotin carboxyl carrier protein subunit [Bacteroidota bacterium]